MPPEHCQKDKNRLPFLIPSYRGVILQEYCSSNAAQRHEVQYIYLALERQQI